MIGVDIVAISRIEGLLDKYGESFLEQFLCKSEIELCKKSRGSLGEGARRNLDEGNLDEGNLDEGNLDNGARSGSDKKPHFGESRAFNVRRVAGFFAAKEALSKALGCGIGERLSFGDIVIYKNSARAPFVSVSERVQKAFNIAQINLSISHDGAYALAAVIVLKNPA